MVLWTEGILSYIGGVGFAKTSCGVLFGLGADCVTVAFFDYGFEG